MKEIYEVIRSYVDEHKQPMLQLWEELVNTESGSRNLEGVAKVTDILRREMEDMGMRTRVIPMENAGGVLVGEWNWESGKAPLLFLGHMDTVFPDGTVEKNPFRVDEEGFAHGPGVLDMKPGLVIALYAIRALAAAGWKERPIKCIFAGDEENLHMFSNAKQAMQQEALGGLAAFNFETGYLDDNFVVGRKGGGPVRLTVHGVAAHSGNAPEKGRSAILEAARKVVELEACNDLEAGRLLNCGKITGGIGENTIPDQCVVQIGLRFNTSQQKEELLMALEKSAASCTVPDTWAEVDASRLMDCMDTTPGVKALFDHLKRTAQDCGYGPIGSFQVGGLSDSGLTVAVGIPTVCGMGVKGEGNHTPNERAEVASLYSRCVLAACAAATLEDSFAG